MKKDYHHRVIPVNRLISNVCEIEGSKIKSGQLTPIEWNQLMARIKHLSGAAGHWCAETHLHIVDSARAVFGHYEFGKAAYVAA